MSLHVEEDSKGKSWVIWEQEFSSSCGPACVYMIYCMVSRQSKVGGEEYIRNLVTKYGVKFWDLAFPSGSGTNIGQLGKVLHDLGMNVNANYLTTNDLNSLTLTAKETKPAILHVKWDVTGGHFVVCAGRSGNNIIILDPYYGLREIPSKLFPDYNPKSKYQSLKTREGRFTGWNVRLK